MAEEIQTHPHEIVDTDPSFIIDPKTKKITAGSNNLTLAQRSKNSERLTFFIPEKTIEGHDMSACNYVRIHFQNIDAKTGSIMPGIYKVTDLTVGDNFVQLSWLVDDDATLYAGALIFSIHFACIGEDGTVVYDLPTLTYSELLVGQTVWNSQTIANRYPDIILDFEKRIRALEAGANLSPEQIQEAVNTYLDANPVTPGATAAQAAQIQANTEAIAGIQAVPTAISTVRDGQTITMTISLEGGSTDTHVMTLDENDRLTSLNVNGREIPMEWSGF